MIGPGTEPVPIAVPIDEARAFVRLEAGQEDALLAAMLRSATSLCEQFVGHALVRRDVIDMLAISGGWQRLGQSPVAAITGVEGVPAEGAAFTLPVASYAIDIDTRGDGWVQVATPGAAGRVRVQYRAGMADSAGQVPEPLRQGILALAAHLYRDRDRETAGAVPAAVAALWRPWRRVRIA